MAPARFELAIFRLLGGRLNQLGHGAGILWEFNIALQFECTFNVSDGPQSLIVVPEAGTNVPRKKAEIEMLAARCVANCGLLESKN